MANFDVQGVEIADGRIAAVTGAYSNCEPRRFAGDYFFSTTLTKCVMALRIEKPLDALRSPVGANLLAWHAPHFLCVRLEKSQIQLATKAIDEEVLEIGDGFDREQRAAEITRANSHGPQHPEFVERIPGELHRINKEL